MREPASENDNTSINSCVWRLWWFAFTNKQNTQRVSFLKKTKQRKKKKMYPLHEPRLERKPDEGFHKQTSTARAALTYII